MKYEATIHFEVKGRRGAGRPHGRGRSSVGVQMMWGGLVDWSPEAKVKIAQATEEISQRLGVDGETADRLWEAMSGIYEQMAGKGLCAYPGGEQSVRVIPEALEFIQTRAAALAEAED
jgi:hypothetical protein